MTPKLNLYYKLCVIVFYMLTILLTIVFIPLILFCIIVFPITGLFSLMLNILYRIIVKCVQGSS